MSLPYRICIAGKTEVQNRPRHLESLTPSYHWVLRSLNMGVGAHISYFACQVNKPWARDRPLARRLNSVHTMRTRYDTR